MICERLRTLREEKKLSRGDIEKRTGLLRCENFLNIDLNEDRGKGPRTAERRRGSRIV